MDSLAQLLFPPSCLICGAAQFDICGKCDARIIRSKHRLDIDGVRLWAAALYGDELAQIILQAKEENSSPARNFLVQLLVEACVQALGSSESSADLILVPVPSRPSANRERGYRHAYLLTKGLAKELKRRNVGEVAVREFLRVNRAIVDQSNLNRAERSRNLSGAYSLQSRGKTSLRGSAGSSFFLIDDLVTSGASAREGLRALRAGGIYPSALLAAGVSPGVSRGVFS